MKMPGTSWIFSTSGQESLSIIIHCVPILLSAHDPDAFVRKLTSFTSPVCGHRLLTITVHCVPVLVSTFDPASLINIAVAPARART